MGAARSKRSARADDMEVSGDRRAQVARDARDPRERARAVCGVRAAAGRAAERADTLLDDLRGTPWAGDDGGAPRPDGRTRACGPGRGSLPPSRAPTVI